MAKSQNSRKQPQKILKKEKNPKKILFKRRLFLPKKTINSKIEKSQITYDKINSFKLSDISDQKNNLNVTLYNWILLFIKNSPIIFKNINNEFFLKTINSIIRNLYMNKNEFIVWTILIEYFKHKCKYKIDIETLFYIGIISKEKFAPNFHKKLEQEINIKKLKDIKKILEPNNIETIQVNKKIEYFSSLSKITNNNKTVTITDYNKMADYISKQYEYKQKIPKYEIRNECKTGNNKIKICKHVIIKENDDNKKDEIKHNTHFISLTYNINEFVSWKDDDKINESNNNSKREIESENENNNNIYNLEPDDIYEKENEKKNMRNINNNNINENELKENTISQKNLLGNISNDINRDSDNYNLMNEPIIGLNLYDSDNDSLNFDGFGKKLHSSNTDFSDFNLFNPY